MFRIASFGLLASITLPGEALLPASFVSRRSVVTSVLKDGSIFDIPNLVRYRAAAKQTSRVVRFAESTDDGRSIGAPVSVQNALRIYSLSSQSLHMNSETKFLSSTRCFVCHSIGATSPAGLTVLARLRSKSVGFLWPKPPCLSAWASQPYRSRSEDFFELVFHSPVQDMPAPSSASSFPCLNHKKS